jgi:hypothetical protein
MKLADYMRAQNLTPDDVASKMGDVSASGVRKWANGDRVPRKDQIERIAVLTNGEVLPNDFFSIPAELIRGSVPPEVAA